MSSIQNIDSNIATSVVCSHEYVFYALGGYACDCNFYPCICDNPILDGSSDELGHQNLRRQTRFIHTFHYRTDNHPERTRTCVLYRPDFYDKATCDEEFRRRCEALEPTAAQFAADMRDKAIHAGLNDFETLHYYDYDDDADSAFFAVTFLFANEQDVSIFERAIQI